MSSFTAKERCKHTPPSAGHVTCQVGAMHLNRRRNEMRQSICIPTRRGNQNEEKIEGHASRLTAEGRRNARISDTKTTRTSRGPRVRVRERDAARVAAIVHAPIQMQHALTDARTRGANHARNERRAQDDDVVGGVLQQLRHGFQQQQFDKSNVNFASTFCSALMMMSDNATFDTPPDSILVGDWCCKQSTIILARANRLCI